MIEYQPHTNASNSFNQLQSHSITNRGIGSTMEKKKKSLVGNSENLKSMMQEILAVFLRAGLLTFLLLLLSWRILKMQKMGRL